MVFFFFFGFFLGQLGKRVGQVFFLFGLICKFCWRGGLVYKFWDHILKFLFICLKKGPQSKHSSFSAFMHARYYVKLKYEINYK